MSEPRISIVTISFNQASYLEECIRSVLEQDYSNLQYIVVDPGSTDGSRNIIHNYKDKGIRAILEPDKGPSDGLNKGFSICDGDIYGYINADDRLYPGSLGYVADFFRQNPNVEVLTGAIRMIDKNGNPRLRSRTSDMFTLEGYIAGICTICQQATFFRRESFLKVGGFNPVNGIAWDGELLVDMALAGCSFEVRKRLLGDFRVYGESLSGNKENRKRQQQEIDRIGRKIEAAGYNLYSPLTVPIRRFLYKANLYRHLSYLFVR